MLPYNEYQADRQGLGLPRPPRDRKHRTVLPGVSPDIGSTTRVLADNEYQLVSSSTQLSGGRDTLTCLPALRTLDFTFEADTVSLNCRPSLGSAI